MNALVPPFGSAGGNLSFADALDRVLHLADPVLPSETCRLNDCIGRALAEPVNAYIDPLVTGLMFLAARVGDVRRDGVTASGALPLLSRTI